MAKNKETKNVVLLAMSTLPENEKLNLREFTYTKEDGTESDKYSYYSQLEPVSRMIKMKQGKLDYVIILSTSETRDPVEIDAKKVYYNIEKPSDYDENSTEITTAIDFYKVRVGLTDNNKVYVVEIENGDDKRLNVGKAIYNAIKEIRRYWKENSDCNLRLWIDTQGGPRATNLMMNVILTALEYDKSQKPIIPENIYYVAYDPNKKNEPSPIVSEKYAYETVDFASGVQEFSRYGRADILYNYYENIEKEGIQKIPPIIAKMKGIAESLQLCDMLGFKKYIDELSKIISEDSSEEDENEDWILKIIKSEIARDYHDLLKGDYSTIDVIKWMWDKKFYQQALTYIEAFMPTEWSEFVFTYEKKQTAGTKYIHGQTYRKNEKLVNCIINEIIHKEDMNQEFDINFREMAPSYELSFFKPRSESQNYTCKFPDKYRKQFSSVLYSYYELRQERNNVNHALEGTKGIVELNDMINKFIEAEKKLEKLKMI